MDEVDGNWENKSCFSQKKRIFAQSSAEKCKKLHKSAVIYVIP